MEQPGWSFALISVALRAAGVVAEAHQAGKVPRIDYLSGREAFRQGLSEPGYVEEKNIVVAPRSARSPSVFGARQFFSPHKPPKGLAGYQRQRAEDRDNRPQRSL